MLLKVIDTETTGLDPASDCVVEFAYVNVSLDHRRVLTEEYHHSLVNPGRPIPPEASAVHHLTDKMVLGWPHLADHLFNFVSTSEPWTPAAHNAV